jgi:hypothetical protein
MCLYTELEETRLLKANSGYEKKKKTKFITLKEEE